MAVKKTLTLELLLKSAGIKPTTEQLKALNLQLQKTAGVSKKLTKEQNKTKRNFEGVAERSGRAGKDFARMAQGMGGLVQAYATVAANVFALSSAFLVLRRAADLSSMIKSAEDFSNRFGVSVVQITKRMQEASGGALDFAEALPSINKAVSAGLGVAQIQELTVAATKAAQTFGGTTTEALNRFISASQRGRVEIIQTLGVVIKTEQAYADYAASIGKTALELTAFDRQQAIVNATIKASKEVFAGVDIDPNPFQQTLTTLTDLKDVIITFVTDAATPFLNFFNKSTAAAASLIAIITGAVASRIFPELSQRILQTAAAGRESTLIAREAAARAARVAAKAEAESAKTRGVLGINAIKKEEKAFKDSLKNKLTANSVFNKKVIDEQNKVNTAILTSQRALLAREIKLREAGIQKGRQKLFVGTTLTELKKIQNAYNQIGLSVENVNIAQKKVEASAKATTNILVVGAKKAAASWAGFNAVLTQSRSALKSGFAQGFQIAEGKVVKSIRGMRVAWAILIRDILVGTAKSGSNLANFSKAIGRTTGVLIGTLSKLLSTVTSLTIFIGLATFLWDQYGDKIKGVTKEQRKSLEAIEQVSDSLQDITERTDNWVNSLDNSIRSSTNFVKQLEFLRGTLDSIQVTLNDFSLTFFKSFEGQNIDDLLIRIESLNTAIDLTAKRQEELNKARRFAPTVAGAGIGRVSEFVPGGEEVARQASVVTASLFKMNNELIITDKTLKLLGESALPKIAGSFVSTLNLFKKLELDTSKLNVVFDELEQSLKGDEEAVNALIAALKTNNVEAFGKAVQDLTVAGNVAKVFQILEKALRGTGDALNAVNVQITAARSLGDINQNISNFVNNIDKIKAASVPNKEIVNFFLNARRALESLGTTGEKIGNLEKIGKEVLGGLDLSVLKEFFELDPSDSVADALAKINSGFVAFEAVIQDSLTAQEELKGIAAEIQAIKLTEAKSDAERVTLIQNLNKLEKERASTNLRTQENNLAVIREQLKLLKPKTAEETKTFILLKAQEAAIEKQVMAQKALVKSIQERTDDIAEEFKIEKEKLKLRAQELRLQKSINAINLKFSATSAADLAFAKQRFKLAQQDLRIQEDTAKLALDEALRLNKNVDSRERQIQLARVQLDLVRAQTRELERQELILAGREAEARGVTIFDKEGLGLAAKFFVRAVRDEARNLKTTFDILGRGFVTVINDTFDTAVENLLEGGEDFGHTIIETIKAGLRDVFGEALKTRIREAFALAFEGPKEDPNKELTDSVDTLDGSINTLDSSVNRLISKMSGTGEAAKPIQESIVSVIDDTIEKGSKTNEVIEMLSRGHEIAKTVGEESKNNFIGLTGTLVNLLSVVASPSVSNVGGLISSFFGSGGVMQGREIPKLANGAITTGPSLAVIGEGKRREAVVPLPNNREIPVDLKGGAGDTFNLEQNFDFSNADASVIPILRAEARAIEERTVNRIFSEINKGGTFAKMSGRR